MVCEGREKEVERGGRESEIEREYKTRLTCVYLNDELLEYISSTNSRTLRRITFHAP